jgi:hypothetical protein
MTDHAVFAGLRSLALPTELYWLIVDYASEMRSRKDQLVKEVDSFAKHIQRHCRGEEKNLIAITARAASWPETKSLPGFARLSCLSITWGLGSKYTDFGVCTRHKRKDELCDARCRNGRNLMQSGRWRPPNQRSPWYALQTNKWPN